MSGTSLDGLDIACCTLDFIDGNWAYSILKARTITYNKRWMQKLKTAHLLPAYELLKLHNEYGTFIGKSVYDFVKAQGLKHIDLVASHGHTVFHSPADGITFQLGSGAAIQAACGIAVASDFRTLDVMLGGQGAPLIPVCDMLLFPQYGFCLNLGGFANISYNNAEGNRLAFDICPVNISLNHYAGLLNMEYDRNGEAAASATVNNSLLARLNKLGYYKQPPPKSLGREWLEEIFLPLTENSAIPIQAKLATLTEHAAMQIAAALNARPASECLVTGGGAHNNYLIRKIREKTKVRLVIPPDDVVNFKEALGFALLGVLRLRGEVNCLKSVTGSRHSSSGGTLYSAGRGEIS
jgi:anhydro-N-acetylmuramic acid kinase